jgi:citrate lyase subunit beta/citryl-CoA lyase
VHFVPAGNDRFLARALASDADTVVLDLEDSVVPDRKTEARGAVVDWLGDADPGHRELMVRINSLDSPWGNDDVAAVVAAGARSLMVPKVASTTDLDALDDAVTRAETQAAIAGAPGVTFFPVATETAAGVFNLPAVAAHRRVDGLCWGAEDLSVASGARSGRDGGGRFLPVFETVRSWCLLGSAAAGVPAIDAVYTDLSDLEGLRREANLAADMGFAGKITVHPDQIPVVNAAFTPSEAEIDEAAALLDELERNQAEGRLAFTFRGQMVDAPHIVRARRLLERAGIEGAAP